MKSSRVKGLQGIVIKCKDLHFIYCVYGIALVHKHFTDFIFLKSVMAVEIHGVPCRRGGRTLWFVLIYGAAHGAIGGAPWRMSYGHPWSAVWVAPYWQ